MTSQQSEFAVLALLIVVAAIIVSADVWLYRQGGPDATISRVVRRWIDRYPSVFVAVLVGLGVFVGHAWLSE